MESVYCNCKKCDATVGLFINLWTQIGKTYFSPIIDPEDNLAILCQGAIRVGERGTLVEECHLQDIVCLSCAAVLGLKCIETPVNHVLDENQVLFRLASVELLSRDGQEVDFTIKRVLDVKEPSKVSSGSYSGTPPQGAFHSSAFPEVVDLLQLQADLEGQREDINRIDSQGSKVISTLDSRVARAEEQVGKLRDTLGSLRRDVGGIQEDLSSLKVEVNEAKRAAQDHAPLSDLEQRLSAANGSVGEMRREVGTLAEELRRGLSGVTSQLRQQKQDIDDLKTEVRSRVHARDHAKDMAALRSEMLQMRRQMDEMRSKAAERIATPFPSKELDILTSNIAKIGNRASQVETLQMEFEILKGRVERTEASRQTPENRRAIHPAEPREPPSYTDNIPGRRKRASSGVGAVLGTDPTSKRPAFSSGYADTPTPAYDISPEHPTPPRPVSRKNHSENEGNDGAVKLTKTGKVDQRYQRGRKSASGKKPKR
ncbi:hypothetical protein B0H67DRAFT_639216 [Lasiosphaeris hirsuta]|uniref:Uncharacterized protein n=1 Tax=Lasiosphaeris hirsuta TaxID=260670 RepID=A0AA40BAX3_9PEZI|nr:hypothetical protein B0H67DRAFT_639216 [Lasiosphaeris hirsuta]